MALTPPTYAVGYSQAEQNANAATITGFIDTNATADASQKSALLAWVQAAQNSLINAVACHGDGRDVGPLKAAFATLVTALGG